MTSTPSLAQLPVPQDNVTLPSILFLAMEDQPNNVFDSMDIEKSFNEFENLLEENNGDYSSTLAQVMEKYPTRIVIIQRRKTYVLIFHNEVTEYDLENPVDVINQIMEYQEQQRV